MRVVKVPDVREARGATRERRVGVWRMGWGREITGIATFASVLGNEAAVVFLPHK